MARPKRVEEEEHENHERWLVTYADMITLLMVLFIVLFSMATVDNRKFNALKDSLSGKSSPQSVLMGGQTVIEGGIPQKLQSTAENPTPQFDLPKADSSTAQAAQKALQEKQASQQQSQAEKNNLEQVRQEIQASLQARGMQDQAKFTITDRGLVVTIVTDKVLFDPGKNNVKPAGQEILDAVGAPLAHVPNDISVEGHTDNQPISTAEYPTNWELSTARATSVLRYLVDHGDVESDHIGATGYADTRPAVPNDSDSHRAQNRRVEIVVLNNQNKQSQ